VVDLHAPYVLYIEAKNQDVLMMEEYERIDKALTESFNFTVAPAVPVLLLIKAGDWRVIAFAIFMVPALSSIIFTLIDFVVSETWDIALDFLTDLIRSDYSPH